MSEAIEQAVRQAYPDAVLESSTAADGVLTLKIKSDSILGACRLLKESQGFDYPASITGIDWKDRFEIVYHLTAMKTNAKIILRVDLDHESPVIDSVYPVWKGADWQEREIFDLLGVHFTNHPDLRRVLFPRTGKVIR